MPPSSNIHSNLIPRFFDVKEGAVLIDGVDTRDVTRASLRAQIALVTQETVLFDDTIANNIAYGTPNATAAEIEAAARAANPRLKLVLCAPFVKHKDGPVPEDIVARQAIVAKLAALEAKQGLRLAGISDRVRRPFTAVLEQDELEALVEPAVAPTARSATIVRASSNARRRSRRTLAGVLSPFTTVSAGRGSIASHPRVAGSVILACMSARLSGEASASPSASCVGKVSSIPVLRATTTRERRRS